MLESLLQHLSLQRLAHFSKYLVSSFRKDIFDIDTLPAQTNWGESVTCPNVEIITPTFRKHSLSVTSSLVQLSMSNTDSMLAMSV